MAKKTSTKTVYYRRCQIQSDQVRTLQQLLSAALTKHPKPGTRYEPLNSESSELRCIGLHFNHNDALCGFLTSFQRGAAQPVISDDVTAASLRLGALAPPVPKKGDAPQQYIPGILYFVIYKNHVAFVSTHSMRSSALESHLNWLLKSRTNELDATTPFVLSDEAQKVTKEKIRKSHVKAIAFGQPLMNEVSLRESSETDSDTTDVDIKKQTSKAKSAFKPDGPMLQLIQNMFSNESDFEKLGLDKVFEGNLEVWIEIRYPKYTRSKPKDSMKLMDSLGLALRDTDGEQVSLELENGMKVSGKELKITGTLDAIIGQNTLPDERELLKNMVAWLGNQIKNGVIDP